jgi:hypothetical protein
VGVPEKTTQKWPPVLFWLSVMPGTDTPSSAIPPLSEQATFTVAGTPIVIVVLTGTSVPSAKAKGAVSKKAIATIPILANLFFIGLGVIHSFIVLKERG